MFAERGEGQTLRQGCAIVQDLSSYVRSHERALRPRFPQTARVAVNRVVKLTLAQAARLVAVAIEHWDDSPDATEPEPREKVDEVALEIERTRELLRRRGVI